MWKRVILIFIVPLTISGVGFIFISQLKVSETVIISLAGIIITFLIGFYNYEIENDRLFKELFLEFNSKYDQKFNNRLNQIVENDKFNVELDKSLIVDYLNFCAEEYLWNSKGRIDKKVWLSWRNGMEYFFKNENIKNVIIEEIRSNKESYYGFFEDEFCHLVKEASD